MRDLLYELPETKDKVARYIVTAASYRGEEAIGRVLKADTKRAPQRDSA